VPFIGCYPQRPYSPGILTKDFLYVSGQGAKDAQGAIPATLEAQLRQCFENVKAIVEAAGLTMQPVVYTQVYLTDAIDEGPLNQVWKEYFPEQPPARFTIGVARLPGTTLFGQAATGNIVGRVTDSSDAVIAGASVGLARATAVNALVIGQVFI
jgi:enamine deaminase RidA (YjgF/YER057c/UK114 family)